jgi:hypothetical protein
VKLAEKQAAVLAAELRCEGQRLHAQQSLDTLKSEFRRSATPGRIVVSGLALGFVSGLRAPGTGAMSSLGGQLLGGPLFSMLLESVLPGLLAGVTAAATAQSESDPGDEAPSDDDATETSDGDAGAESETTDDESDAASEEAVAEAAPKPRRRRKHRVDA